MRIFHLFLLLVFFIFLSVGVAEEKNKIQTKKVAEKEVLKALENWKVNLHIDFSKPFIERCSISFLKVILNEEYGSILILKIDEAIGTDYSVTIVLAFHLVLLFFVCSLFKRVKK